MANFALQIAAGASVAFTNNANLQADTKVYGRFRILGAFLKDQGNNAINPILNIASGSSQKLGVYCHHLFGGSGINFVSSAGSGWDSGRILDFSSVQGSLVDTDYYEIEFLVDPAATPRATVTLYDVDASTVLATASASGNITTSPLPTGTGVGAVTVPGSFTGSALSITFDWLKLGTASNAVQFDAEFNEGTGTSTTDSVGASTGTITGTHTWVSLPNPPDHGTVTLTPSSILKGATSQASVQWFDASNALITPTPSTSWRVNTDSKAATITSVGTVTGQAAGTATIRATSSGVNATSDITVRPLITFTETVTAA